MSRNFAKRLSEGICIPIKSMYHIVTFSDSLHQKHTRKKKQTENLLKDYTEMIAVPGAFNFINSFHKKNKTLLVFFGLSSWLNKKIKINKPTYSFS